MGVDNKDDRIIVDFMGLKVTAGFIAKCIIACFVAWLVISIAAGKYGTRTIGNYFERDNYTTVYWVYMQPDGAEVKNYHVRGGIEKVNSQDGASYYLRNVNWPNGGVTKFEDCDITDATSKSGKAYCAIDDSGYTIRLGDKVPSSR